MSFEIILVAACGFCQGFLGFPTIMFAPKLALLVADIWAIDWKERRISNSFCLLVILLFAALAHGAVATATMELAKNHHTSIPPGKIWALFIPIGVISYCLVPGIEWRIRKFFKKSSSQKTDDKEQK